MLKVIAYFATLFILAGLSKEVPIIGVPLGILFTLWILYRFLRSPGSAPNVTDTEPWDHHHRY